MKIKIILLLILIFISAPVAFTQKGFWVELSGEVKNAMGGEYQIPADIMSTSSSWIPMPTKFSLRGSIGADLKYYFDDYNAISLGLCYSGTGQDYDKHIWSTMGISIVAERHVSIHYLEIPLQYSYIISPAKKISFIIAGGFYGGFLLNYGIENTFTVSDGSKFTASASEDTYKIVISDQAGTDSASANLVSKPWNGTDAGAILSAGFQIKLSDKMFLPVMLKYQVGLGNVKNKSSQYSFNGSSYFYWEDDFYGSPNIKINHANSSFGLKIGLRFRL